MTIHKLSARRLRTEQMRNPMGYLPRRKSRQKFENQSGKSQ